MPEMYIYTKDNMNLGFDVSRGQLASLRYKGIEFMHNAEKPGWTNHEITIFPVFVIVS